MGRCNKFWPDPDSGKAEVIDLLEKLKLSLEEAKKKNAF
jgi:non-homologous end joining protein Ku